MGSSACRAGLLLGALSCLLLAAAQTTPTYVYNTVDLHAALTAAAPIIYAMAPMSFSAANWTTVTISTPTTIFSPYRSKFNFCDAACNAGVVQPPFIVVSATGTLLLQRIFLVNFQPKAPSATALSSPLPAIQSRGGAITFKLVIWHWMPGMLWAFDVPGFWANAVSAASVITPQGDQPGPFQVATPQLWDFNLPGTGPYIASTCFMPVDADSCYDGADMNATLFYCPYTFGDSLRNPFVHTAHMFAHVGLDRLDQSFFTPTTVSRTMTWRSCGKYLNVPIHMDLDSLVQNVVVATGGVLTFDNITFTSSKNYSGTGWPANNPLLLSPFIPKAGGSITLANCTVTVVSPPHLLSQLQALPGCTPCSPDPTLPNLRPLFSALGAKGGGFTLSSWDLDRNLWNAYTTKSQANILEPSGNAGSWHFDNVQVIPANSGSGPYQCFPLWWAPTTLGPMAFGKVAQANDSASLLAAMSNVAVRFISVTASITLDPTQWLSGPNAVQVGRLLEIRACAGAGAAGAVPLAAPFTIDLNNLVDVIHVTGRLIWDGQLQFAHLGWDVFTAQNFQALPAFGVRPLGSLEFQDAVMWGMVPTALTAQACPLVMAAFNTTQIKFLLPSNVTADFLASGGLLSFVTYTTTAFTGGSISWTNTRIDWTVAPVPGSSSGGSSSGGASTAWHIIVPVISCVALVALGALSAALVFRHKRIVAAAVARCKVEDRSCRSVSSDGGKAEGRIELLLQDGKAAGMGSPDQQAKRGGKSPEESLGTSFNSALVSTGDHSVNTALGLHLETSKMAGGDLNNSLVLDAVLGVGSYARVYKAYWKGSLVAVKVMVLPTSLSGCTRRETMAVMETKICSTVHHPNIVTTFTYSVEQVLSTKAASVACQGDGASVSVASPHQHRLAGSTTLGAGSTFADRTLDLTAHDRPSGGGAGGVGGGVGGSGPAPGTPQMTWEVRLVQEFCDRGTLREALDEGSLHKDGKPAPSAVGCLLDTAIDIARAVAHLHAECIIHSDLKPHNVLLRSCGGDARAFTAKVADFGLSLRFDPNAKHVSNTYQGTLTHMAPEVVLLGQVSVKSDVYAFGIMLWELWTGKHAFHFVPKILMAHAICKENKRPEFPPGTPFDVQLLACRCWESDPEIRPNFNSVLEELERIRRHLVGPSAAAGAEAASARPSASGGALANPNAGGWALPPAHSKPQSSQGLRSPPESGLLVDDLPASSSSSGPWAGGSLGPLNPHAAGRLMKGVSAQYSIGSSRSSGSFDHIGDHK